MSRSALMGFYIIASKHSMGKIALTDEVIAHTFYALTWESDTFSGLDVVVIHCGRGSVDRLID